MVGTQLCFNGAHIQTRDDHAVYSYVSVEGAVHFDSAEDDMCAE